MPCYERIVASSVTIRRTSTHFIESHYLRVSRASSVQRYLTLDPEAWYGVIQPRFIQAWLRRTDAPTISRSGA
jgi:hypothetical protein